MSWNARIKRLTTFVRCSALSEITGIGINIRALDEGKTFNTFDEEFQSPGYQSTGGPVFQVDYTVTPLADGDINGDGSIDAADVLLATRHILGLAFLGSNQIARGDLYPVAQGGGVINLSDFVLIQKAVIMN